MGSFADKVVEFNSKLVFNGPLPPGVRIMNPFAANCQAIKIASIFYQKYYNDKTRRHLILGINPGRFGAAITGIPFTDTKRLKKKCGITLSGIETHEPSSYFVYEVIDAFGGPQGFYSKFYINSICPLGFTIRTKQGKEVNYNYYDNPELTNAVYPFIVDCLQQQIAFGLETNICFCLGTGKNFSFLVGLNNKYHFFKKILPLEHPRYVMQYKSIDKLLYIEKYLTGFKEIGVSP